MVNILKAQEWLNEKYPNKEKTTFITNVDSYEGYGSRQLVGELSLNEYTNLQKLELSFDYLTDLDLNDCFELKRLVFMENLPHRLGFLGDIVNSEKLTYLDISNNNFSRSDLHIFSKFVNLEELFIGNDNEGRIKEGKYNRFYGSLRPLKKMKRLKLLDIENTDIEKGLRHLPESLENLFCRATFLKSAKVKKIEEKLLPFGGSKEGSINEYKRAKQNKWSLKKKKDEIEERMDELEINKKQDNVRNVLIIGRTGNGKSALANVLIDKEIFKESSSGVSETKNFQIGTFEWKGIKYRTIDTIGVGDTKLSKKDVLIKIAEAVYNMKDGINQVFFVVGGSSLVKR